MMIAFEGVYKTVDSPSKQLTVVQIGAITLVLVT